MTYLSGSTPFYAGFYAGRAIGNRAAGSTPTYVPRGATPEERGQNAQGVLATPLTAKTSGQMVVAYVAAEGCRVEYLYIT